MYNGIHMDRRHKKFLNMAIILGLLIQFLLSSFKSSFV